MSRMLLIGGVNSIYRRAREHGFTLTVVQSPSQEQYIDAALVDDLVLMEVDDPRLAAVATRRHARTPFDCVVGLQELALEVAGTLTEEFGVLGNPLKPVRLTRDKLAMRRHLDAKGLPNPPFVAAPDEQELIALGDRVGWPVMLKGRHGASSAQVRCVPSAAQARASFAALGFTPGDPELFAEGLLRGREFSVETLSWGGEHETLAITEKATTGSPEYVELGHTQPADLTSAEAAAVAASAVGFLDAIGQVMGPAHTEVMLTDSGPTVIESNTRTGGDFISDLVELSTGVSIFDRFFARLAGRETTDAPRRPAAAGTRYLPIPPGRVVGIEGEDAVRAATGVVHFEHGIRVGDVIGPVRSSMDRRAALVVRAPDRSALEHRIATAAALLRVDVRAEPGAPPTPPRPMNHLLPLSARTILEKAQW